MSHVVIVCGSETHPHTWQTVQSLIEQQSNTCSIFDWSGIPWGRGIPFALDQIASHIGTQPNTVLVGHSIAGLFLPLLADRLKASAEIYVAAMVPKAGYSFLDQVVSGEDIFDDAWVAGYQEMLQSKEPQSTHREFLEHHLFHDCAPNTLSSSWRKSVVPLNLIYSFSHPSGQFSQRHRHYLVCANDRSIRPEWQASAAEMLCGGNVTVLNSGHCPQIAQPKIVADALKQLVVASNGLAFRHNG